MAENRLERLLKVEQEARVLVEEAEQRASEELLQFVTEQQAAARKTLESRRKELENRHREKVEDAERRRREDLDAFKKQLSERPVHRKEFFARVKELLQKGAR